MRRWVAALGVLALVACADLVGTRVARVSLVVVPSFGSAASFAANADQLHIAVTRDSQDVRFPVLDTTVAIDAVTGDANASFTVVVLQNPTILTVTLEAIRSSDGVVLFSGMQQVAVGSSGGSGQQVTVPVAYQGPRGASLAITPHDTGVAASGAFTFQAVVRDTAGAPVAVPVTFALVRPADSTLLSVGRYTGTAKAASAGQGTVRVAATSADSLVDTATVLVNVPSPAKITISPGYADVAIGSGVTLAAVVTDAGGNALPATVTWMSRSPSIAAATAGVVTGAAAGTAVIVATADSLADSALVTVPAAGQVVVSTTSGARGFAAPSVGDTVAVSVTADMTFTPNEVLGSYNATLSWDPATLAYVDLQPAAFAAPTVNETGAPGGTLRFSSADPNGVGGAVVVAVVRFVARAPGAGATSLTISEMSAAQTYTNLLSRVTVTNGIVTVRP